MVVLILTSEYLGEQASNQSCRSWWRCWCCSNSDRITTDRNDDEEIWKEQGMSVGSNHRNILQVNSDFIQIGKDLDSCVCFCGSGWSIEIISIEIQIKQIRSNQIDDFQWIAIWISLDWTDQFRFGWYWWMQLNSITSKMRDCCWDQTMVWPI